MPKINSVGLDDMIAQINRRTTRAIEKIPKMLEAGAAVLVDALMAEADIMIAESKVRDLGEPTRSLGELKASIKADKIKKDKGGLQYIEVYPHGKDSKGVSNATKGFVLEYGTSRFAGYPWITTAKEKAAGDIEAAYLEVWQEDLE